MSIEAVRREFADRQITLEIIEFDRSTATVETAAAALGVEPGMIAKTMAFEVDNRPILILLAGSVRIDNRAFRRRFGTKAKMLSPQRVEQVTGHRVGGVCPFGLVEQIDVFLDRSLRAFRVVYPAAGSGSSAVRVPTLQLEQLTGGDWVDVSREYQQ